MAALEGTVEAHARDRLAVRVETEEEERNAVAVFEVAPAEASPRSRSCGSALGLVEVDLPQVGRSKGWWPSKRTPDAWSTKLAPYR